SAAGPPLAEVARVAKGAGTNADPVYVFEERDPPIEAALLRPCLRGRDVGAYRPARAGVRCLVPYTRAGELIAPELLARRYPRAAAYLDSHRDRLEARERGRF